MDSNPGRMVIVAYRPLDQKEPELKALLAEHWSILMDQNLVTARPVIIMKSRQGEYIEIFEWASSESIEKAHHNEVVQALWQKFAQVCDYIPISQIAESEQLFSEFTPMN